MSDKVLDLHEDYTIIGEILKKDIVIMPTDTIYGICTSIYNKKKVVEEIYNMKTRNRDKPFIVLVASKEEAYELWNNPNKSLLSICNNWPKKTTIIFYVNEHKKELLPEGKNTIGVRCIKEGVLHSILKISGPVFSTSVNISGKSHANSFKEVLDVFQFNKDKAVFVSGDVNSTLPSSIIKVKKDGSFRKIR